MQGYDVVIEGNVMTKDNDKSEQGSLGEKHS